MSHVTATIIDMRGLRYRYPGGARDALADIDLQVEEGGYVAVVGPNGSGKSTLARVLGGLAAATGASVASVVGHDLLSDVGRKAARRDVGVLFQNPDNQIVGTTVEEDLAFGLENLATDPVLIRDRVDETMAAFDLTELREREPHTLSGGQRQRLAMASVLAIPRRILILDEPTAMLDARGRVEVLGAVRSQWEAGMTVLHVTQEMEDVLLAGRVLALDAGGVAFSGSPVELFADVALVRRLSLGLPPAAELGLALAGRGTDLARLPLDAEELIAMLAGERS